MSTHDEEDVVKMQFVINQRLYDMLAEYHKMISNELDESTATVVIISAVATNLGSMIAHMNDHHREKYLNLSKEIIDMSFSVALEDASMIKWGIVGHA